MAKNAGLVGSVGLTGESCDLLGEAGADHIIADLNDLKPLLELVDLVTSCSRFRFRWSFGLRQLGLW